MSLTIKEVKDIAPDSTLPSYAKETTAIAIVPTDTIKQALQKVEGQTTVNTTRINTLLTNSVQSII